MSIRATRGVRLLVAAALAWVGLALCAQAALAPHGRIKVVKINQGGNPNDTFAFHPTLTWAGPGEPGTGSDFSLKGGESSQPFDVACNVERPGHVECSKYTDVTLQVAEQPTPGYSLTDVTCRFTQSNDDNNAYSAGPPGPSSPIKPASEVTTNVATGTVDLKVHYNEWVVCYFTNTAAAAPPTSPPGGQLPTQTPPAPAPQPQIQVSPARVRPGSATLRGPTGCPTTNAVAATDTGKRIVKGTFSVDGKKVKTLTKANASGGRWVLPVNMRRLAYGTHRVTVQIQFAKSSETKSRTLRLSFNRCHAAVVKPNFTG